MRKAVTLGVALLLLWPCIALSQERDAEKEPIYLTADRSDIKIVGDNQLQLHYYDNVKFRYKGADLFCDTAVWYDSRDLLEFWGDVRYSDSLRDLTTDYLRYEQVENKFYTRGKSELVDKTDHVKIRGKYIDFDRNTEELLVTDSAYLAVDYNDPAAMIEIVSDTLRYMSQIDCGKAIDNVMITKGSMVAVCDLCEFFPDSNSITLHGSPHAVQRENELEGDTMFIMLENRLLDQINVVGNGKALYRQTVESDSTKTFTESRIEAKNIRFYLENEILEKIISSGNSYSWYLPAPEDTTAEGRNEASGDSIQLFFGVEGLDSVQIKNACVGKFYSQMEVDSLGEYRYLDTVSYESTDLNYDTKRKVINLVGNATVRNKTVTLDADTVTYNTVSKDLRAYSALKIEEDDDSNVDTVLVPVVLRDGAEEMTGDRLAYNLESRRGKVREIDTELEKAYYHGEIARKVDEDVLLVEHGRYTTCDLETPHFHFGSSNMKIVEGDKVIARPIVLYIEGIPVFYSPFFVFSIKKGRHSGFLPFQIGTWDRGGREVRNFGYYWAASEYWDLESSIDIQENEGVSLRNVIRYAKRYKMSGSINTSYSRDSQTSFSGRNIGHRWSITANHSQTLTPTASLSGSGTFVSDKSYFTDFSHDVNQRLNRDLRSQLNFSKRWERSSLTAVVQSTKDLDDESSTFTLPSLSFRMNSMLLIPPGEDQERSEQSWYNNLRLSYSSSALNYLSKRKSGDEFNWTKYAKVAHSTSLSSPQKILGYLTVNPSLSFAENWFYIPSTDYSESRDLKTDEFLRSWRSSMSVSANTSLYGYFFPPVPGLIGLRHTVSPSVSFSFTPKSDLNVEEARFVGVSTSTTQRKSMNFSLSNLMQMKYKSGDQERKLDLFNLSTSVSYDFEKTERKWGYLSTTLRTSTVPIVRDVTVQAVHDLYNPVTLDLDVLGARLTNLSVSSGLTLSGRAGGTSQSAVGMGREEVPTMHGSTARPWNVNVGYRYSESRNLLTGSKSITHWITSSASFNVTRNWSVDFQQNYDIRRKTIVSRSIRVYRDLHCWEASFEWIPNGSSKGYFFKINVKAIPEIKFESEESPIRSTFFN